MAPVASFDISLDGYDINRAALEQLARVDIVDAAYKGSASGAARTRDNAKANVLAQGLFRTGALYTHIIAKREKEQGLDGIISYIVAVQHGPRKSRRGTETSQHDPYYWFFWEFGTRRFGARPFMVPALAGHEQAVGTVIRDQMYGRLRRNKLIS
jgi:HK97 gp10 family phage protein